MDSILIERLNILTEAGEINAEINSAVMKFASAFEESYGLEMTEENASMLITHLAMALARIKRGEQIDPMDESGLNEIKAFGIYEQLEAFYKVIEKDLNLTIPESEKGYMALHACALLESLKQ